MTNEKVKDGIIELDCEFAKEIEFTSDKFEGYLWKVGSYIYISVIKSVNRKQGNLSALFNTIQEKGFGIKVPSPFPLMEAICNRKGFERTIENADIEVWVLNK